MAGARLIGGKYELLRKIAAGGMAEVYLAKQTGLVGFEKLVVIKRILPHLAENEEFVRMFLDEARTAADLRHANVVQIYEVGEDQGTFFIAMEFLHGQDLRRILRRQIERGGRVPLQHALQMIIDAAAGLHSAHQKADLQGRDLGIIHRDISPQNVIVTYDGSTKIVDFGIAKAASQSSETRSGVLKGKYSYMSPEQAAGEEIDQRTDMFALGIVAYELSTATRLFKYPNEIMTLHAIIECRITPPADVLRGFPLELNEIFMRALAKDRAARFPDLAAFAAEIEEFMAREGMVHSPQRVASYMQELFDDVIEQEAELGHPLIADEGSAPSDIKRATARGTVKEAQARLDPAALQAAPTVAARSNTGALQSAETQATAAMTQTAGMGGAAAPVPAGGGSKAGIIVGAVIGLLALIAVGAWFALGNSGGGGEGRVLVETTPPGATVFVDGQPHPEKTPTTVSNLEVGRAYVFKVSLYGYETEQKEVLPTDGRAVPFKPTLRESSGDFGVVKFTSAPKGAKVYINGKAWEQTTPFEIPRLKVGDEITAVFSLDGVDEITKRFTVEQGVKTVHVDLEQESGAKARITVITDPPGATVSVGGEELGEAPLKKVEVAAGDDIEVLATLDGYQPASKEISLDPGDVERVTLKLERAAPVTGTLHLDSKPSRVAVSLDGKSLGKTPLKGLKLADGEHTFTFTDRKRRIDQEETITVVAGEVQRETIKLASSGVKPQPKGKGTLKVIVRPWADVYVDGKKVGTTPFSPIKIESGSHRVRLVNKELGKDVTKKVTIRPGKETRIKTVW